MWFAVFVAPSFSKQVLLFHAKKKKKSIMKAIATMIFSASGAGSVRHLLVRSLSGRAGVQQHAWMDRPRNRWFEVLPHPRVPGSELRLHPAMEHCGFVHEVLVRGRPVDKDVRHLHQHLQVCGMRGRAERGLQGLLTPQSLSFDVDGFGAVMTLN